MAVQNAVRELIRAGLVRSAHDCSEGGLAVALAESCFNPEGLFGADVEIGDAAHRAAATALFNESQSRIVISCAPNDAEKIEAMLRTKNVSHQTLGAVTRGALSINEFSGPIETIYDDWFNAIRRGIESDVEPVRGL